MPTLDQAPIDIQFTLFKGEPGTRKSTCALSYPTPQYWFSNDQKMGALRIPANRWGVNMKEVEYDDYVDWEKQRVKLESFRLNCPFRTIIVDSVTSTGDSMTSQVRKTKRTSKGGDGEGKGKMIGGIPVSGLEEFNAESSAFQEMIALLQDIHNFHKVNIVLIAHVIGIRKDDDSNKLTHHSRVIVTGAERIAGKIASRVKDAYHFNIKPSFDADKEGNYALLTVHTGNDYARTSLPLPREIVFDSDPLYEKWIAPAIKQLKAEQPIQRITPSTNVIPTTMFDTK